MSDQEKQTKQSTPPPLLLMGASQGLTLDPPQGGNLLFPVPQSESSVFPADEGGEEDSFVGQTQTSGNAPFTYFQQTAPPASDPFASVGQNPFPAPTPLPAFAQSAQPLNTTPAGIAFSSSPVTQVSHTPAPSSVVQTGSIGANIPPPSTVDPGLMHTSQGVAPPPGQAVDYHRQKGPPRYAAPPTGSYTPAAPIPSAFPPSVSSVPPPSSLSAPQMAPHSSYMTPGPELPPLSAQSSSSSISMESDLPTMPQSSVNVPQGLSPGSYVTYIPVQYHWFYMTHVGLKQVWTAFSISDSNNLEQAFRSGHEDNVVVSTDGGRYDVDVIERTRTAVYWDEPSNTVKRCSWFYRPDGDNRFVPFDEDFCEKLEEEYKNALVNNIWHKKLEFPNGETIVMHNPNVIVNFSAAAEPDQWGNTSTDTYRPRVVKRGVEESFDPLVEGEPSQVDHLVFVVHGIGSTCDLRFRSIIECVDDIRSISMQMLRSHFRQHQEEGRVGRVEILPVRWHEALHGDATGIDRRLKAITLNSIGKLRHFTNDTLLDILFYSSPTYAQKIADTVGAEINRLYSLFLSRNTSFKGGVSVSGHSLGSLILFDLLVHQQEPGQESQSQADTSASIPTSEHNGVLNQSASTDESTPKDLSESFVREEGRSGDEVNTIQELLEKLGLQSFQPVFDREHIDMDTLTMCSDSDIKEMGLPMGPRKKIQGFIAKQKIKQETEKKELTQKLKEEAAKQKELERQKEEQQNQADQQQLGVSQTPSESLLPHSHGSSVDFVLGGTGIGQPLVKYPQLDFQPCHFFALGSPVAMFLTVRGVEQLGDEFKFPTCPSFFNIFHPFDPVAYRLEPMIVSAYPPKPILMPHHMGRKRLHLELKESLARMGSDLKQKIIQSVKSTWKTLNDFAAAHRKNPQEMVEEQVESVIQQMSNEEELAETESIASSMPEDDILVGNINQGRRIDYVLQEKPIESFNDYLFALGSHGCYWESEDTVLMLLKEIYAGYGFAPIRPGKHAGLQSKSPLYPPPTVSSGRGLPPQSYSMGASPSSHMTPEGISQGGHVTHDLVGGGSQGVAMYGSSGQFVPGGNMSPGRSSSPPTSSGPPPLTGFVPRQ